MKIKDVVGECLVKMGQTDFSNEQNLDAQQIELKNQLLAAINIIYREIVSEYLPLYHTQKVAVKGGKIDCNSLEKKILYPVKVVRNGEKQSYFSGADCVHCNVEGEVEITYAYMPSKPLAFEDEIVDMRLTSGVLSDGALGEFYFQNKTFDLAKSFDSDFRAKIGVLRYKGKNLRIKARRWQA